MPKATTSRTAEIGHTPIDLVLGVLFNVTSRGIGSTPMEAAEEIVKEKIIASAIATGGRMQTTANERRILHLLGLTWGEFRDAAKDGSRKRIERLIAKALKTRRAA